MQWSHYSEAIFDHYTTSTDNLIVQACPGAGKTTNIKHLWTLDDRATLYLVFNKHNQLEAEEKLPKANNKAVLTLNSLGHRIINANYGRVTLDRNKVLGIIDRHIKYGSRDRKAYEKKHALNRAVTMAKQYLLDDTFDVTEYEAMLSIYDLEEYEGMYGHVLTCLDISDNTTQTIDYADQIRLPALYQMSMPTYHNVLCDEVQDFSPIQTLLVQRLQAARYGFVGDNHQSIYGFRGAMADSMEFIKSTFQCVELPLSITYRCSRAVVAEAYKIFPDIEVWDEAAEGVVRPGNAATEDYPADMLVVCRFNRPLVTLAFSLLKRGIACHVRGRDIGEGLVRLVKQQEALSVRDLLNRLTQWQEVEVQKARAKRDEHKEQSVTDKFDSLLVFISQCSLGDDVSVVIAKITALFEQGKGVCLSTIHKAKGLEASKVLWLEREKRWRCSQAWQMVQESNAAYVAVTRAKAELVVA